MKPLALKHDPVLLRSLELIHSYSSLIPFLALVLMLLYIFIARIELGYWPYYGSQPDPSAFGYHVLEFTGVLFFACSVFAVIVWLVVTCVGIFIFQKHFSFNYWSTIIGSSSIGAFFAMNDYFPAIMEWYMD